MGRKYATSILYALVIVSFVFAEKSVFRIISGVRMNGIVLYFNASISSIIIKLNRLGRKYTTSILFALTALSSFGITIGYTSNSPHAETVKLVCALISRLFLSGAWGSLIIYTVEMFPTMLRYWWKFHETIYPLTVSTRRADKAEFFILFYCCWLTYDIGKESKRKVISMN